MLKNPIGWFEIYVDDISRTRTFYETVLEVSLEKLDNPIEAELEMWAFPSDMESYGATGALVKMEGMAAGGNSTLVYFSCEDCAVEASRVVDAGGRLMQPKMAIGQHGFIAMATDSEGNMFGLHSMS